MNITEGTYKMEIVETTDHYLLTVYSIYDGDRCMAEAYSKRDAEVIKAALEKDKEERAREESAYLNW